MSVADTIGEPLLVPGQTPVARAARVEQILALAGPDPDSAPSYPHQFSGGQRQRISSAKVLANRPRILLADDPVSALEVSVHAQMLNLLADLVDEYALTL